MTGLAHRDGELCVESVPLADIATRYGTPCFVYSRAALAAAYREFDGAFAARRHLTCYAMKANSNLAVLDVFARLGSGFDVVSGGELARVLAAGATRARSSSPGSARPRTTCVRRCGWTFFASTSSPPANSSTCSALPKTQAGRRR